jgi:DNA-binding transcriptional LysR family regulator
MFDWEDLRHFAALAREGSLSAAARRLEVDHATVARRIAALERSSR